ncbi:MAG: zinc-regulated TonB-dependent outer membrane receptor [bacterium]
MKVALRSASPALLALACFAVSIQASAQDASTSSGGGGSTWTQPIRVAGAGPAYLNLSLDALFAAGTSSEKDVTSLEIGGHDPSQRGFTIENVEAVFDGAIDPYFKGTANIVFQLTPEGETNVELEEAYLVTQSLPADLQVKAGQYFTEFGRLNNRHPHQWDFVDIPLVNGRLLGGDGLRGPGARASWLMPLPFYSELIVGVQNSQGETAASFRNENEGEPLFGRVPEDRGVDDLGDMLWSGRWSSSFDVADDQTLVLGLSGVTGPNATGANTHTQIYGTDLYWKWKSPRAEQGFPFASFTTELMYRRYQAGAFEGESENPDEPPLLLPHETLEDWGLYAQALYGFTRGWVAGLRGDFVDGETGAFDPDPDRSQRVRLSPVLTWYPSEFSKLRLQYNLDRVEDRAYDHSIWLQAEFLIGSHGAHSF